MTMPELTAMEALERYAKAAPGDQAVEWILAHRMHPATEEVFDQDMRTSHTRVAGIIAATRAMSAEAERVRRGHWSRVRGGCVRCA